MGLYARYVLPVLIDVAMRNKTAHAERARFVPLASGVVLEIGSGSGLNIPIYGSGVRKLYALDPSAELLAKARPRAERVGFPVEFVQERAEAIPLADDSVDWVVTTWTLCTIPDPAEAFREIKRVLRTDGRVVFIEHGRSPDGAVARWQDRLTPYWRKLTGGCHLNRPIDQLLLVGGFDILEIAQGYMAGPKVGSYLYRGMARPA